MTRRYFSVKATRILKPFIFIALLFCDFFNLLLKPFSILRRTSLLVVSGITIATSIALAFFDVISNIQAVMCIALPIALFVIKILTHFLSRLINKAARSLSQMYFSPIGICRRSIVRF